MVIWGEMFNIIKCPKLSDEYNRELDNSKEGINRLIELTERLDKMELDIHKQCKFLNAVANSWDNPMWVKDINGIFLYVNTACAEIILKTTVEKALHLTDSDFKNDALATICIQSDKKVTETKKVRRFIEHARYSDRDLWLDVVKTPLIVNDKLTGIIGTAKDITNIVPQDIKDLFFSPGAEEIDLNLEYYIGINKDRRKNDLREILNKRRW